MRRPRRLFRGSGLATRNAARGGLSSTIVVGLAVVIGGACVFLGGAPSELFGRAPVASGVISADARSVAVVDGDTLRLHETVIRLQGVQAPRRGAACRAADGSEYDCGRAAAAALGKLLRGQTVACRIGGRDPHGLPQGECDAGGAAVNRAIVAAGWARASAGAGDGELIEEERRARAAMRGVWRGAADPFL